MKPATQTSRDSQHIEICPRSFRHLGRSYASRLKPDRKGWRSTPKLALKRSSSRPFRRPQTPSFGKFEMPSLLHALSSAEPAPPFFATAAQGFPGRRPWSPRRRKSRRRRWEMGGGLGVSGVGALVFGFSGSRFFQGGSGMSSTEPKIWQRSRRCKAPGRAVLSLSYMWVFDRHEASPAASPAGHAGGRSRTAGSSCDPFWFAKNYAHFFFFAIVMFVRGGSSDSAHRSLNGRTQHFRLLALGAQVPCLVG